MIEGVLVKELKIIADEKGDVLHMIRHDDPLFTQFGEVYFSVINPGFIKGWKKHNQQTQHFVVPDGQIKIVLFDEAEYQKMLSSAHQEWGKNSDEKHNAIFILEDKPIKTVLEMFPIINPKYEKISYTQGVIFWSGSKENFSQTSYAKELVKSPAYKICTIRNSNTSFKLKELFDEI